MHYQILTKEHMRHLFITSVLAALLFCSCSDNKTSATPSAEITAEMAFEGVNNYCHSEYDWSAAEGNPDMMYVTMGEETETEYKVIFRSYTGALVYFYVDKATGKTRMVEYVPALDTENEVGTLNLSDYLKNK